MLSASSSEKGKPFQYRYHALWQQTFRIPSAGKCASKKVKLLQRITSLLAHHKIAKKNKKNKLKEKKIALIDW